MKDKVCIFWFRRDLRLEDNAGLFHALSSGFAVLPVFIFDTDVLEKFEQKCDRRVDYIHRALFKINAELKAYQSALTICRGKPSQVFKTLCESYDIQAVFCNRDYEPEAIQRDTEIYRFFLSRNIPFRAFKDQVVFDRNDVLANTGKPYTVYTPYAKKWKSQLRPEHYKTYVPDTEKFYRTPMIRFPSLSSLGYDKTDVVLHTPKLDATLIGTYEKFRDYPAMQRTTQLGMALRFGTISIRMCVAFAAVHNQTWLNELIWREFFMQILYHFPQVVHQSFKPRYDHIRWRNDELEFKHWCSGTTGYALVDAGMRQLNQTGYMHNRVRMVVAGFLCKHLLIDWRWGEAYFAQKLNDYDLAANNGNWQWAAGSGCDAAPYFRVFNPHLQTEKFDRNLDYVKQWVPEFGTDLYPQPIVAHQFARERALKVYGDALKAFS